MKTYNELRSEFSNVYSDKISSPVAQIFTPHTEEMEAIANLFAAAPDLLEACEFALKTLDFDAGMELAAKDKLEIAVAKAKGAK